MRPRSGRAARDRSDVAAGSCIATGVPAVLNVRWRSGRPVACPADTDARSRNRGAGRRYWLGVTALGLAGAGIVLVSSVKYGAGISPDSVAFLDVARSFASGKGLVFHTGKPLVESPPLYPLLLGLVGAATRLDPTVFAQLVNAVLFAGVIFLWAELLRTGPPQRMIYNLLCVCAVLFSIPLREVYSYVWSECLFVPLSLIFLVYAQRYWNRGGVRSIAAMACSAALACVTRYVGVALLPAGIGAIVLARRSGLRGRVIHAFAFASVALVPLELWALRDYLVTKTLFGKRGPHSVFAAGQIVEYAKTLLLWYVPGGGTKCFLPACSIAALIAVGVGVTAMARVRLGLKALWLEHGPALLLVLAFAAAVLATTTTGVWIDSRMLSPVYIPTTLMLLTLVRYRFGTTQPATASGVVAGRLTTALISLWLFFPLTDAALSTVRRAQEGAGVYNMRVWRESETVAYARGSLQDAHGGRIYSNGFDVLWELARVDASQSPSSWDATLAGLRGRWPASNGSKLVWFRNIRWRPFLYSVEELRQVANVVEIAHLSDGSVYRLSAREETTSTRGATSFSWSQSSSASRARGACRTRIAADGRSPASLK